MTSESRPNPMRGVPPAFVVAVGVMLVSGIVLTLITTYAVGKFNGYDDHGWWLDFLLYGRELVSSGMSFAANVLVLVGFAELVRRSGPGTDGMVLRAGLVAMVVILATSLATIYMSSWWYPRGEESKERFETYLTFWRWRARVVFVSALVASGALVVAGRRFTVVLFVAIPFLILTALQHPTQWIDELVSFDRPHDDELWGQAIIDIWIRISYCGALMATLTALGASLPPASTDMVRSGQGLERIGSGLVGRVVIILVWIFTMIMTVGAQSPSMARVSSVIFPVLFLMASIAIVTGFLQVGGLSRDGAPRMRLYTGAALTITAMVMDALKGISLYLALRRDGDQDTVDGVKGTVTALPYVSPALALAGLWCVLSAASAMRRMAPEARVDQRGINAAAASVTIFTIVAVALFRWGESGPRSPGVFVLVSVFVGFANIIAQLAVARVCHRVGAAMREVSALPTAVATVK
jgi:hypothetical protein